MSKFTGPPLVHLIFIFYLSAMPTARFASLHMATLQAVVHNRQQAVGIGRQVNPHDIGLLVDDVVDEAGVLMREAVVVMTPDMRS